MPKDETLKKVRQDLERGDLGKARDRLHGLIRSYPDDLGLRSRLAEVYHRLHFPAMAGRYWYLEESQDHETVKAVEAFEKECGGDPRNILLALKVRGDPEVLASEYACNKIKALQQDSLKAHGDYPVFPLQGKKTWEGGPLQHLYVHSLFKFGCLAALAVSLILMIIGFITAIYWIVVSLM